MNLDLVSAGINEEYLDSLSFGQLEVLIARASFYEVRGYTAYMIDVWNSQDFDTEEEKDYCWHLYEYCVERIRALQTVIGYGPDNPHRRALGQ